MSEGGPPRVGEVLARATRRLGRRGVTSARLDAELLLAWCLGRPRAWLLAHPEAPVEPGVLARFARALRARARRVPLAYLTGRAAFYGLELEVTPDVLVPRPETEAVVEAALAVLDEAKVKPALAADLGTGSGAIALALAAHRPDCRVVALDVSRGAARVAAGNAVRLGLEGRVWVVVGDFACADRFLAHGRFDLVVSNPPYVGPHDEVDPEVRREPPIAVWGSAGPPPAAHRAVAQAARSLLAPGGALVVEVGAGQAGAVSGALREVGGFGRIRSKKDLAGIERVLVTRRVP